MKVRIKFTKQGPIKFIGHLDTMRFFQKLIRRARIPIAYSNGMSPHQIMSFALPLGIGDESEGEYVDIELTESVNSADALAAMNATSAEGIKLLSFKELPEDAENAMASVWAADYLVSFRTLPCADFGEAFRKFMALDAITTLKKTKKGEHVVDIRPFVFNYEIKDESVYLRVKCGSVDNTKPELVMQAFYEYLNLPFDEFDLLTTRLDLLTMKNDQLVSLDDIGADIV